MLLNLLGSLIGFCLGGLVAFGLLFGGFYIASLVIQDQSSLGWVWILYLLVVPFGAILGLVLGYLHLGKMFHGIFT
jgi:hypothetical protein